MKKRWYIVHVYSGFENKVVEAIKDQAEKVGLSEYFGDILVPMEQVTEVRRGQKVDVSRNFFPGYILVSMVMEDQTWHLVRSISKVSGFLGANNKPAPISNAEAEKIMSQIQEGVERPKSVLVFEVGEQVKVSDGPFASFTGVVEVVDEEKNRLKVSVSIFGRSTPVELEYNQVEKLS